MNIAFAKEVGLLRYVIRRILWRLAPPTWMELHTGVKFRTPKEKFFASDVFVTECNVDWNSEYILARYLIDHGASRDVLDIGAHIGYYSVLLSPYARSVWAFEPDERNLENLQKALADISNAHIVTKAVSDQDGEAFLSDEGESSVSHLDFTTAQPAKKKIAMVSIDSHVREHSLDPIAIKIDIEGFDILALRGAVETARTSQPVFLVEYNLEEGRPNTWAALEEFVQSVNYTIFTVSRRDKGLFDYHYTFSKRRASDLPGLNAKMIFLVPSSQLAWFSDFASRKSSWTGAALRPTAIRSLLSE